MQIELEFELFTLKAEIFDTPTGRSVWASLPVTAQVLTWGDEFYFGIPAEAQLEAKAEAVVEIGALAYWPTMPAFCVFFGPTPVSHGQEARAASPVNVFGKLLAMDLNVLRSVRDGDELTVRQVTA
ncbi:MAG: hypothetical protein KTR30_19590 [Saprospiraceae bacterium]|nr:hypothetical protein [Saprospiraceae bacterium]